MPQRAEETSPLLGDSSVDGEFSTSSVDRVVSVGGSQEDESLGEAFDNVPRAKRQLGLTSAVFLVFNRVIGTGIYATPSVILRTSGSVGVALVMWLVGALIAAAGTAVYVELGTGLPRNGGEKNYLEFIYRRPRFLVSCSFVAYTLIIRTASSSGNARLPIHLSLTSCNTVADVLHALDIQPTRLATRLVAVLVLTFCLLVHGTLLKFGLRLQNTLGAFKLLILSAIALLGLLSLLGVPALAVRAPYNPPHNLDAWAHLWAGSRENASVNGVVTALYGVIWSFIGYANANYALSEVRDPVRTIKRAAPLAMGAVTVVYMAVNVAYFAVVSREDILGSKRIVAALFFRNLFGPATERALSAFIALSTLGNLLAGQFTQGRVIQELGREGILPYSAFFASNKPFGAPLAGLLTQYIVSCAFVLGPPPGDAYLFMISTSSYSLALINTLVSLGLLLLHTPAYRAFGWAPPFRAPRTVTVLFFLSNIFLVVVPLVPPAPGRRVYDALPYYLHAVVALAVSLLGAAYWGVWGVWLPRRRGYALERVWVLQEDGVPRWVFRRVGKDLGAENVDVSALKITIAYAPVQTSFKDPKFQRNGVMSGENLESVMVLAIIAYLVDIAVTSRSCSRPPCSPHPPPMDDALAPTISALRIHDNLFLISISFLYWDHLMTFGDEVRHLWRKPKTPSTYSFLLNRYLAFFGDVVVTFFVFNTVPDSWCKHINLFRQLLLVLNQTTICLLLALRIYALYGRRRKVWVYMLSSAAVLMGVSLWAISGHGGEPVPHVIGCHIANSKAIGIHLAVPWEALFTYDIIIVVALLYKSIQTRNQSGTMRSEPLLSLLIRDGAVYFVLMALINLANILTFYLAESLLRGCLSTMASCLSVTMMSRLMLNLHAVESTGIFSTTAHIKYSTMTFNPGFDDRNDASTVELDTVWTRDLERSGYGDVSDGSTLTHGQNG
ncbi:amino acid permease-domain-containing protein [Mycena filopes]|nr:amino acid permease-domain-containing protein [Mycena filopes]